MGKRTSDSLPARGPAGKMRTYWRGPSLQSKPLWVCESFLREKWPLNLSTLRGAVSLLSGFPNPTKTGGRYFPQWSCQPARWVGDVKLLAQTTGGSGIHSLPSRLNLRRLPIPICHHQRLPSIRIMQRPFRRRTPRIQSPHPHREVRLQFVHPQLHFMLRHRLPNIRRPVLVQLVRIFHIEHFVGINLVLPLVLESDRHRIAVLVFLKRGHHLLPPARRGHCHYVFYLQPLDRPQQSRVMSKIDALHHRDVSIIGISISLLHPHRL